VWVGVCVGWCVCGLVCVYECIARVSMYTRADVYTHMCERYIYNNQYMRYIVFSHGKYKPQSRADC